MPIPCRYFSASFQCEYWSDWEMPWHVYCIHWHRCPFVIPLKSLWRSYGHVSNNSWCVFYMSTCCVLSIAHINECEILQQNEHYAICMKRHDTWTITYRTSFSDSGASYVFPALLFCPSSSAVGQAKGSYITGLVQERRNSITNALGFLPLSHRYYVFNHISQGCFTETGAIRHLHCHRPKSYVF